MNQKSNVALIVAGGKGSRMGVDMPKQYMQLSGKAILERTYQAFADNENIQFIQIVISKEHQSLYNDLLVKLADKAKLLPVCFGGDTRQESVSLGLEALTKAGPARVLIHDSVRPFVSNELINKVIFALKDSKCAVPALKISDSVKEIEGDKIKRSLLRENMVTVQTPQGFDFEFIYKLHQDYKGENLSDDTALAELMNEKVVIIEGEKENYKITTIDDLEKARSSMSETRTGSGFDVHQFEEGEFITLCGIKIPFNKKLKGHSDADCAWHALTDAILGAIGEGDIGEHFPDSDAKWKNADSGIFLKHASELLKSKGGRIANIDITVICEKPKLKEFKNEMRINTAKLLGIEIERVNIKATTTEKLGFLGREEGLAVQAIVSVKI